MLSDGARKQLYRALELFLVPPEDSQIEEHLPEPEMEFRRIRAAVQPPKHLDGLLVLSFRLPGRSLRLVYPAAKIVRMGDLEPQRRHRFGPAILHYRGHALDADLPAHHGTPDARPR